MPTTERCAARRFQFQLTAFVPNRVGAIHREKSITAERQDGGRGCCSRGCHTHHWIREVRVRPGKRHTGLAWDEFKLGPVGDSSECGSLPKPTEFDQDRPVGGYLFPVEKEAVGSISLADDLSVDVFPNYQGKLIKALVELGDQVNKGQPLYTIDSPDLIQAESTLIGAAATLELTAKELTRAKALNGTNGVSERELEQAVSDQQTAEGALKAARDAVRVFGKSDAAIDQIVASRKIDPVLVVLSPIAGKVTAFNAPPGLFVQPGNAPAPYSVANVTVKWMLADVPESDVPSFHPGQPVEVKVTAYPARLFKGRITKIYETVDPNTHRETVRSEISDPRNELRPGMLATFTIGVQKPIEATAIPANGVVRESDGAMTAWVTSDRRHFDRESSRPACETTAKCRSLAV